MLTCFLTIFALQTAVLVIAQAHYQIFTGLKFSYVASNPRNLQQFHPTNFFMHTVCFGKWACILYPECMVPQHMNHNTNRCILVSQLFCIAYNYSLYPFRFVFCGIYTSTHHVSLACTEYALNVILFDQIYFCRPWGKFTLGHNIHLPIADQSTWLEGWEG